MEDSCFILNLGFFFLINGNGVALCRTKALLSWSDFAFLSDKKNGRRGSVDYGQLPTNYA